MKRPVAVWFWILALAVFGACSGSKQLRQSGLSCEKPTTIVVVAKGLHSTHGQVRMALFASSDGFPNEPQKALQRGFATLVDSTANYTFAPVPCESYAVSVFHDEDGNGEMKTDFLGRPQEGWGVSRDAPGRFGPPSFDDAVFVAEDETTSLTIHMEY